MKKTLFIGLAALLMAGLSSCSSSDDVSVDIKKPLETDKTFFANIAICSTETTMRSGYDEENPYDNTKDPAFDKGTEDENKINSIFLIFYDADGNRVSTTQVRKDNDVSGSYATSTGDIIYSGVVQIDVKHGSQMPAYVMCFVNPITSTNFAINPDFETLTSLQAATRPRIIDDNGVFAMSKSVYWGTDRVNNTPDQKIIATPLFSGDTYANNSTGTYQLFNTREEAENADEESIVNIYVERYAAKVSLQIEEGATNGNITLSSDYTLKFVPEYWAVNSYESKTYVCKSFLAENGDVDLTFDELQTALSGGNLTNLWHWNSPELHRCYWAQSPGYYEKAYPRVADDIADNPTGYALGYYSYDEIVNNASDHITAKAKAIKGSAATTIYARENTVSGNALATAASNPDASVKAAIASAVIVGHYDLYDKNNTKVSTKMFYIMGNATNGYTVFKNEDEMKTYFVRTTIPFALDAKGEDTFFNYNNGTFTKPYQKYFTVVHPYDASRENLVVDSRFVTIQLTKEAMNSGIYAYINGEYRLVDEDNFNEVNKQMFYAAGTVQGFNEGKVFYNIPIKHLGFYRKGNVNADKMGTESTFNWKECFSGDFGLVRNHSYSIVVSEIKGLGNGIPNPDDPIVPPTDPEEYFIGAKIIVLNWAVVPEQKVKL